jgi:nucleotide-binding universal stress UspA family protein
MRIVVGLDGSASSMTAHELIANTSWPQGTEFLFVRAYDLGTRWAAAIPGGGWYDDTSVRTEERDAWGELDSLADPLRRQGHPVQIRNEEGPAATLLRDAASEFGADLLVVGSRGRGPAASAFLGSVSANLVDHAPCPVLVARQPCVTHVLVATDGSSSASTVPSLLMSWRAFSELPLDVVSVVPARGMGTELMVTPWAVPHLDDVSEQSRSDAIHQHQRYVDDLVEELERAGWKATGHVRTGDAADEILASARERRCDLIVTGSHGLGDLHRLIAGSVAHDVLLRSHCSVLVMRGRVPARVSRTVPVTAVRAATA